MKYLQGVWSFIKAVTGALNRAGQRIASPISDIMYVVRIARFSIIMVAAGWILLWVDQGRDLLLSIAESEKGAWLIVGVTWWALNAWYWSRILLDFKFPGRPPRRRALVLAQQYLPRILGFSAFAIVAWFLDSVRDAAPASGGELSRLFWWTVGCGVGFYLVVQYRRWAVQKVHSRISTGARIINTRPKYRYEALSSLTMPTRYAFGFAALVGAVMFFWAWIDPLSLGSVVRPEILYFLWAGTWIPLGSALTYWSNHERVPVLTGLLVLAAIFSLWIDNHDVRVVSGETDAVTGRPEFSEAVEGWKAAAQERRPFIVVATAGGGSRAAYWTATVLGKLQDKKPSFCRNLFAISGVSGGSLGAAAFRAALSETKASGGICALPGDRAFAAATQHMLERNFLGPALASAFYPDLAQRFFPISIFNDRAQALERAWEKGWRAAGFTNDRFAQPFLKLWEAVGRKGQPWLPALFLNGTWVETGHRLITTNIRFGSGSPFVSAYDMLNEMKRDVWLSTAANNSARFPIVAPAGTFSDESGKEIGRIVDGGYFENFGAITAREVVAAARNVAEPSKFVVIQISSDPGYTTDVERAKKKGPIPFLHELRSPARAFMKTREARGGLATQTLEAWAHANNIAFAHLRLCPEVNSKADPPLGWFLSDRARRRIRDHLDPRRNFAGCARNKRDWGRLAKVLDFKP